MTLHRLFSSAVLLLCTLAAHQAVAQQAPWNGFRPKGMTEAHDRYAAQAQEVRNRVGSAGFGDDPLRGGDIWTWQNGRNKRSPLSNMHAADATRYLTGKYFVSIDTNGTKNWNVQYYAEDGTTHFCDYRPDGAYLEYTLDRYVYPTPFGLSGTMHWDAAVEETAEPDPQTSRGWPMVADPKSGQLAHYSWHKGKWVASIGWVQAEYAAAFAEYCPSLPKSSKVNEAQEGQTLKDVARGARAVTGFPVAFESDPENPLTVEMFYWAYPPK